MINSNEIIRIFEAEMSSKGITPPKDLIANGKLYRFHIQGDKPSSKNGWYVLYMDKVPCGVFGSWKTGDKFSWCFKKREYMSHRELTEYKTQMANAKHQRDLEHEIDQGNAALLAKRRWYSYALADPHHSYLVKKRIAAFWARQCGLSLVLPIINFFGEFRSLQYIREDGSKKFLLNGAITGHFIPVQGQPGDGKKILICEGFGTAATLAQNYPDCCVVAACDAGNLKPVALNTRQNLPNAEILICADDDRLKKINTGLIRAREAAQASGSLYTQPEWPAGAPKSLSDFNDLACWLYNLEATK